MLSVDDAVERMLVRATPPPEAPFLRDGTGAGR